MKRELRLLNLTRSASWDEIKKAYREKMKRCHPDLQGGDSERVESANKESQDVNVAFEKLKMCLSQTGRFICPILTAIGRQAPSQEVELGKTNIVDFFKSKSIQKEVKKQSTFAFLFNTIAILLWLGVLFALTVKGVEYFQQMY